MIRHRDQDSWLPLLTYLSENAAAITSAANHLGGPALTKLAQSVIDDARLGQEPTRRLIAAIDRLCRELDDRSKMPAQAGSNVWQSSIEQNFAIHAEISLLVDELRYLVVAFRVAHDKKATVSIRGAA